MDWICHLSELQQLQNHRRRKEIDKIRNEVEKSYLNWDGFWIMKH